MDGTGNTGLNPADYWDIAKWLIGAVAFLGWGYVNRLAGRVDRHDSRLNNHGQRLAKLDGQVEDE